MKNRSDNCGWMGITLVLCVLLLLAMLLPGAMIVAQRYGPEAHQITYRKMNYLHHLGIDSLFGSLTAFALNGINILLCVLGLFGKRTARWVLMIAAAVFGIAAFICVTAQAYTWMSVLPPMLAACVLFAAERINKKNR